MSVYIAVVGPGEGAGPGELAAAHAVGELIASRGWVTLTGGRDAGVMAAASAGAAVRGGVCVGVLPGLNRGDAAPRLTVALTTGLGEARNAVLVNSADAVVACGMNAGTLSEIALAIRARKPVVLIGADIAIGGALRELAAGGLVICASAELAMAAVQERLKRVTTD